MVLEMERREYERIHVPGLLALITDGTMIFDDLNVGDVSVEGLLTKIPKCITKSDGRRRHRQFSGIIKSPDGRTFKVNLDLRWSSPTSGGPQFITGFQIIAPPSDWCNFISQLGSDSNRARKNADVWGPLRGPSAK